MLSVLFCELLIFVCAHKVCVCGHVRVLMCMYEIRSHTYIYAKGFEIDFINETIFDNGFSVSQLGLIQTINTNNR